MGSPVLYSVVKQDSESKCEQKEGCESGVGKGCLFLLAERIGAFSSVDKFQTLPVFII